MARIVAFIGGQAASLSFGAVIQWLLFGGQERSVMEALLSFPALWLGYFILGLALAEHILRLVVRVCKPKR